MNLLVEAVASEGSFAHFFDGANQINLEAHRLKRSREASSDSSAASATSLVLEAFVLEGFGIVSLGGLHFIHRLQALRAKIFEGEILSDEASTDTKTQITRTQEAQHKDTPN